MYNYIMDDCAETLQYIPLSLLICIFVWIILTVRVLIIYKKNAANIKISGCRNVLYGLLLFYMSMLVQIALLSREPGTRDDVSMVIGGTWTEDPQGRAYVIENILLFIPYGVIMYIFFQTWRSSHTYRKIIVKLLLTVLSGLIVSFAVEVIQYITERGFFQIDDIITNTAGSLMGGLAAAVSGLVVVHIIER